MPASLLIAGMARSYINQQLSQFYRSGNRVRSDASSGNSPDASPSTASTLDNL